MKIQRLALIMFIIISLWYTISIYSYYHPNLPKRFEENNELFQSNRKVLDKVIQDIEKTYLINDKKTENLELSVKNLPEEIKNTLQELGIGSIEIKFDSKENCHKKYSIILNVIEDWNIDTLNVVQLIYAPCDEETILNYHYYDGYHRDCWGLGGDWCIYSDTDFI